MQTLLRVASLLAMSLALGSLSGHGQAQEGSHGVGHAQFHDAYRGLMRPDMPTTSCCSDHDCRPTAARYNAVTGNWEAVKDGRWITIPKDKIVDGDVPGELAAEAHICAPPPSWTYYGPDEVFCFIRPKGGM